jgi:transcription elongation factor S-II
MDLQESLVDVFKIWFPLERARRIEQDVYEKVLMDAKQRKIFNKWSNNFFTQLYIDRGRTIFLNLKNNESYLASLQSVPLEAISTLLNMTHQEINPERWQLLIDKLVKRDKRLYEYNMEASTNTFTCGKCKKNNCSYYLQQTRSADEPMTTFVTCLDCGFRWKC